MAQGLHSRLCESGYRVEILDGDAVRRELNKGLGFSLEDRTENIRRISFVARLLAKHGVIVLIPVIAPYRSLREEMRAASPSFFEVFVNAPLNVCEQRDVKGLYARARAGDLRNFTGIDDPYEAPERPDIECRTDLHSIETCVENLVAKLEQHLESRRVSEHA